MLLAVVLVGLTLEIPTVPAGAASPVLRLITEPNAGIAPIDELFSGAKRSVDLVMYELADPHLEAILAADAARSVRVRVFLDRSYEEANNSAAYTYLTHHGVAVRWASDPGIDLTHEKAAIIDDGTALIMTLNFVADDYSSTRDFAVIDSQSTDVHAIEAVFAADWSGTSVTPPAGTDLVWSPGSESALVALIDGAHHSLLIENEEMGDRYITAPLEAAARRGVRVEIAMTSSSSWESAFDALGEAGALVRTLSPSASLYIHAKAIVADAGYADQRVFVGSENFSIASLVYNRELGLITSSQGVVNGIAGVIRSDFASALPWTN